MKKGITGRLLSYAGKYKYFTYVGVVFAGLSSITTLFPVYYIWKVATVVISQYPNYQDTSLINKYAYLAVFYALLTMVIYLIGLLLCHLAAFRIARNLRTKSINHLMKLPLGYFTSAKSGKLRQIIDECASSTETLLAHNIPDLVAAMVAPIAIYIMLFSYDITLGIVGVIPILLSFISMAMMFTSSGMKDKMNEKQLVLENLNNEAIEYVRGIPVVKTFGQTIFSFKKFHKAITKYKDFAEMISVQGRFPMIGFESLINSFAIFLTIAGLIMIALKPVLNDFIVLFLFGVFLMPICTSVMYRIMYSSFNTILSENSLNRIEELYNQKPLEEVSDSYPIKNYDITFNNVSFKYEKENNNALNNVSFNFKQGKTYGLVGPSGGGKTTLATLIPRFFDVTTGEVKIGDVNVKNITNQYLNKYISFVFQQTSLYKMSILDNVRESKPEATIEEVMFALKQARCLEFIDKLKDGIYTVYGSSGVYLSGGEAQRLAIAKAILKDAPIVLLDEATSFTDPENEYEIKKALTNLTKDKTVIMIAHRLSSVVDVDEILYVEKGEILEHGKHQELLDKKGKYYNLYQEYQTAFNWNNEMEVN